MTRQKVANSRRYASLRFTVNCQYVLRRYDVDAVGPVGDECVRAGALVRLQNGENVFGEHADVGAGKGAGHAHGIGVQFANADAGGAAVGFDCGLYGLDGIGRDAAFDEQDRDLLLDDEVDGVLDVADAGFVLGADALDGGHLPAKGGAEVAEGVV